MKLRPLSDRRKPAVLYNPRPNHADRGRAWGSDLPPGWYVVRLRDIGTGGPVGPFATEQEAQTEAGRPETRCEGTNTFMSGTRYCELQIGHEGPHQQTLESRVSKWSFLHQVNGCLGGPTGSDTPYGPEPDETPNLPGSGEPCPKCGTGVTTTQMGRHFGPFLRCSAYPDCDYILRNGVPQR
jgi:hypothetical protein